MSNGSDVSLPGRYSHLMNAPPDGDSAIASVELVEEVCWQVHAALGLPLDEEVLRDAFARRRDAGLVSWDIGGRDRSREADARKCARG